MVDTQPPTHTYAHKLAHAPIKTKKGLQHTGVANTNATEGQTGRQTDRLIALKMVKMQTKNSFGIQRDTNDIVKTVYLIRMLLIT